MFLYSVSLANFLSSLMKLNTRSAGDNLTLSISTVVLLTVCRHQYLEICILPLVVYFLILLQRVQTSPFSYPPSLKYLCLDCKARVFNHRQGRMAYLLKLIYLNFSNSWAGKACQNLSSEYFWSIQNLDSDNYLNSQTDQHEGSWIIKWESEERVSCRLPHVMFSWSPLWYYFRVFPIRLFWIK